MLVFAALAAGGLVAGAVLAPRLARDPHALGTHAAGLVVPYAFALFFAAAAAVAGRLGPRHALAAGALFALLSLPFAPWLASPIVHYEADDSYRYSVYARHMLAQRTLWGSDGLLADGARHYVDQPGYRYYLAATIALTGGEHRGLQLFDMGVLLAVTLAFLVTVESRLDRRSFVALAVFLAASAPYAAKNVLYGYGEWLAVALLLLSARQAVGGRTLSAVILLALVPFVRQNLLPVSLLLAALIAWRARKAWLVAPFLAVLALPVYHNLYYAGELRLLVQNKGKLVRLDGGPAAAALEVARVAAGKLPPYLGYHPDQKPLTLAIAVLFVPLGTALVVWNLARARGPRLLLLAAIVALTVAPTLVFGSGSYPRFVYVNLTVALTASALAGIRGPWNFRT